MSVLKIDSKQNLERFLRMVSEEAVTLARKGVQASVDLVADEEAERQKQMDARITRAVDRRGDDERSELPVEEEEGAGNPEAEEKPREFETEVPDEIKFNMIRDELNNIRSGRSLKDPDIKMELIQYYEDLDEPERISLYKFLEAISKIVTQGIDNELVASPGEGKGKVITKSKTKVTAPDPKKEIKPRSKKAPTKSVKPKSSPKSSRLGKEDTSPPIKVGEAQTKESLHRELKVLMKS